MISLMNCETMRPRKKFEKKKKIGAFCVVCFSLDFDNFCVVLYVLWICIMGKK